MSDIRDCILSKLEYDKEEYNRYTYPREYRSIKLKKFQSEYATIKIAYLSTAINDIPNNGKDDMLLCAQYEPLPDVMFALLEELSKHQSMYLHIFYPSVIRNLCFKQNIYFLDVLQHSSFNRVFNTTKETTVPLLIIPICYMLRFGIKTENNRMQVMFYVRSYANTNEHGYYIDNIPLVDLKRTRKRNKAIEAYILNTQDAAFRLGEHLNLSDFASEFDKITAHGT
jgi:hypothetical protein